MLSFVKRLDEQLLDIEAHVIDANVRTAEISAWNVGQQLEHLLIAMTGIMRGLQRGQMPHEARKSNELRDYAFTKKSFPRGAVQAPAVALPSDSPDTKSLKRLVLKPRNRLAGIMDIPSESMMNHPILDWMTRDECIEFMTIHNDHHLAIIRDILRLRSA